MRLTLRTLLAYLDDILDPADKEELSKKIESSGFAEDLVHRTRDTVRRLRLSAPHVLGTGMALDPNTVAEYLDNVLPPESVGDFERICLESDMHLAEAAACHHVLTMVLGEPADVDPVTRQRMYTIPTEAEERMRHRVEAAHVAAAPAAAAAPLTAARPAAEASEMSTAHAIPDYLRASSWSGVRGALVGGVAAVLMCAMLYTFYARGWFGGAPPITPLTAENSASGMNAGKIGAELDDVAPAPRDEAPAGNPASAAALPDSPQPTTPNISAPLATGDTEGDRYAVPQAAAPPDPAAPTDASQLPPVDETEANGAAPVGNNATADTAAGQTEPTTNIPIPPVENDVPAAAAIPTELNERSTVAPGPAAPVEGIAGTPVEQGEAEANVSERPPTGAGAGVDPNAGEAPAMESDELGTYLGGKSVLLRYDEKEGGWFRVDPRGALRVGEKLLALPAFRPKITLSSGVNVDVSGGTLIALGTADELPADGLPNGRAGMPAMDVGYGRVVLINTSSAETPVRLRLGSSVAEARLARNATLGIEVERQYVPGHDPRQSSAPVVVNLYAPDGGISWQDVSGTTAMDTPSRCTLVEGQSPEVSPQPAPAEWIDQEPVGQLSEQRFGALDVEQALVPGRSAEIQLLELFQGSKRREVKSLVARSAMHVGLFEPFVDALRDSEQRANWPSHIGTLRSAMALSPESAGKVWQTLVEQRGREVAGDLYEMLCGYNLDQIGRTPDERKAGALARLIGWLEEDSLDYRVLAWYDLWEITGMKLMLDPTANLAERKRNVRKWQSRLASDEVRPIGGE